MRMPTRNPRARAQVSPPAPLHPPRNADQHNKCLLRTSQVSHPAHPPLSCPEHQTRQDAAVTSLGLTSTWLLPPLLLTAMSPGSTSTSQPKRQQQ